MVDKEHNRELFSQILPSYLTLWENDTQNKFLKDIKQRFLNVCWGYSLDYKIVKNTHHNVASVIITFLHRLKGFADDQFNGDKNHSSAFTLFALKIILIALHQYLDEQESKNFIKRIKQFEIEFPELFSDQERIRNSYSKIIDEINKKYEVANSTNNGDDIFLLGSSMFNDLFVAYSEQVKLCSLTI